MGVGSIAVDVAKRGLGKSMEWCSFYRSNSW